jgi:hypothetical protein
MFTNLFIPRWTGRCSLAKIISIKLVPKGNDSNKKKSISVAQ